MGAKGPQQKVRGLKGRGARSSSHCSWFGTYISAGIMSDGDWTAFVSSSSSSSSSAIRNPNSIINGLLITQVLLTIFSHKAQLSEFIQSFFQNLISTFSTWQGNLFWVFGTFRGIFLHAKEDHITVLTPLKQTNGREGVSSVCAPELISWKL